MRRRSPKSTYGKSRFFCHHVRDAKSSIPPPAPPPPPRSAFDRALDYLALRDRSETEIRRYLENKKKYPPSEVDNAILKLKEYGYINDERFARGFASGRFSSGHSSSFVRRELLKKGINREIVSDTIKETKPSFEEEVKNASSLVLRKYHLSQPIMPKDKNRIASFLARRGYEWEVIRKVLSGIGAEVSDEE